MINAIQLYNTLSGTKELFKPLGKQVLLYVCGITPYDYAHMGHGRCYVTFDLLYRLLKFGGYSVTYCRNFTDIDDKLIDRALARYGDANKYIVLAQKYIDAYHEDMKALGCLSPTYEPRVTQTISEIIVFIQGLIDKNKAYVVDGDVYFSIDSFKEYGALSKCNVAEQIAGARVEVNDKKRNPLDFALWKSEPEGSFWQSPWGYGRPGWHIECSAMANKFLGETIDIHAGGMDLIFPHHENEIAQSEALHEKPFVRYWMHNGFVRINQEKMSKSLGNFFTLRDVFKEFDPMVVRFYFLNHHYRAPLDFSFDDLKAMHKTYQRLCRFFKVMPGENNFAYEDVKDFDVVKRMLAFVCDDLNTPGMFGVLFESLPELQQDRVQHRAVKAFLQQVLGLPLLPLPEKEVLITEQMQHLIDERHKARAAKDWAKADELRDQLKELGYDVQDKKLK